MRRKYSLLVAAAAAAAALAATTAASVAGARPLGSDSKKAVTVTIWIMNNGAHPVQDMNRIVGPFEKQTGINVKVQLVGWDIQFQRIQNAATSGEAPDVTQAGTTQVPFFASLDGFENLSSRIAEIGGRGAYTDGQWTTTQVVGKAGVWSVPWFSEARAIYYRTDIYKQAKVNPATAFRTWSSFRAALRKVEKVVPASGRSIAPFGTPGKTAWDLVHHVMPFVWGAGGAELTADVKRSAIASPQAVTGVKYFADLVAEGLALRSALERNAPQVENQFKGGELATWIGGPWVMQAATRADDENWVAEARNNFSTAPLPLGPTGKSYTFVGGSNLMLFKSSDHKNEAWQLIKYLSRNDVQLKYAQLQGMFPARVVPQKQQAKVGPLWANFYKALVKGRSYAPIAAWGPIENVYKTRFGNILDIAAGLGRSKYNRAAIVSQLKAAEREANELLSQGG